MTWRSFTFIPRSAQRANAGSVASVPSGFALGLLRTAG